VAISEEIYRLIWIGSGEEGPGDSVLEVYKEGFRVLWSKGFLMRRNSQTIFLASVEGSRYNTLPAKHTKCTISRVWSLYSLKRFTLALLLFDFYFSTSSSYFIFSIYFMVIRSLRKSL